MGLFDSPLFWIILVWWLLSIFLGAKARKRRRVAMEMAALEVEEPVPPGPQETPRSEPSFVPRETPEVIPAGPTELPPPLPPKPVTPLQEIFRALGMEDRPPLFGALRAEPEPEITPVDDQTPTVVPEKVSPPPVVPTTTPKPGPGIRRHYRASPLATLERLTPWQQAVMMKEILDSPLALRSRNR